MVTEEGIKQYQENNMSQAVVKRVLSSSATQSNHIENIFAPKLIYQEGTLTLDSLMRVSKFEKGNEFIVFIEKPRKVIVKKVEEPVITYSIKEDLKIELVYKNIQANEKGKAYTEIKIINKSNNKYENLHAILKCGNATREWNGTLGTEVRISFNLPARFSEPSIRRNISIEINHQEESVEYEYPITIKRYTPVRSR